MLRPYQDKIIADIKVSLNSDHKAPLVVAPTGAGKTRIFSTIAKGAREKGNRFIILTHRREILQQTVKTLFSLGVPCGQIISGKPITHDLIQVASVQTLVKRLSLVKRPSGIITDEAHHTTDKNTWGTIHNYWSEVPNIGFTATPERLDGAGLGECYDDMILGPSLKWLVDEGWLAYPHLLRQPDEVKEKFHLKRGDFDQDEQFEVMSKKKIVGDVISHYREHLNGAPTICACVDIKHAKLMADQFQQAGFRAGAVWGNMPDSERDSALSGLADGRVQIVCFADLIGEGVDIPAVSGLICLRRTASLALFLQWVGRALRPVYADGFDLSTKAGRHAAQLAGPKPRAIILDHAGNYHLHGHPIIDRPWSLASKSRRERDEAKPVTTWCPECDGVWPGKPQRCPACGYSFALKEQATKMADLKIIEGQLVEAGIPEAKIDETAEFIQEALKADSKNRQKMLLGKAFKLAVMGNEGLQELTALAGAVGYRDGWTRWAWQFAQKNKK